MPTGWMEAVISLLLVVRSRFVTTWASRQVTSYPSAGSDAQHARTVRASNSGDGRKFISTRSSHRLHTVSIRPLAYEWFLTSTIHTRVKSPLTIWLSCGNTLKQPREPAPFGCGP